MRLLIDTNLLVLYIVGTASRDYISKHKRLSTYSPEDYDALLLIINRATEVLVTPNTLTETSNLATHINEPARGKVLLILKQVATTAKEIYVPSQSAAMQNDYLRLGLTDAVLIEVQNQSEVTLLTADFDLWYSSCSVGASALNFNHIRDSYLS